jgi:L-alanine-DL-glutamate epimerase-like enolase superfamily enzyme
LGQAKAANALSCAVVEIKTDEGITGHGFTAITDEEAIATLVRDLVAPALLDDDPLNRESISEKLYWLMTPRGQTGYASHVISAVDLALWDILGKFTGLPCWRLLGGARNEVPLYVTFGFGSFSREQLVEAATHLKGDGVTRFKMVVGAQALARRDQGRPVDEVIREDVRRVAAVRDAIGPEAELFVDANCSLDPGSARWLADAMRDQDVSFFEEPMRDNDVHKMRDLRHRTGMRVAAGQNEGQLHRFRELITQEAVDVIQPNVVICGGFTAATKVAGMAQAHNVIIDNGGAFPFHNMHLHAGLASGGLVEWHLISVEMCRALYTDLPERDGSVLKLPDAPGLGFVANADALRDFASRPSSRGAGKG